MSLRAACFSVIPMAIATFALLATGMARADDGAGSLWSKIEPKASLARQDEFGRDVNAGLSRAANAGAVIAGPVRVVFTAQANLSARSSVVFERSGAALLPFPALTDPTTVPNTKMGLEFRPVSDVSLKQLGSLRVQLAGNSSLLIRPRSGGVALSWRSQF